MKISYSPLINLLESRKMSTNQLSKLTGLSSATMAKIRKGSNINTEVLTRICSALNCDLTDIMRLEKDDN